MKVPTYTDSSSLQPTPIDPRTAATLGGEVVDVSKGLSALGGQIREMNNKRQTLQAQTALSQVDAKNWELAATDPDLDHVLDKINKNTQSGLEEASKIIQDPQARNSFLGESKLDMTRRNVSLSHHVFSRQSDAFKQSLVESNDSLVEQYKDSADKNERMLLKKKSYDQTEDAVKSGFIHGPSAKAHLDTLWHKAAIDQVKDDSEIDAEATLEELQKGKEGLYSDISDHERKSLFETVKKQVEKQGMENNHVMSIASNHAENRMLEKMANNTLTMDDITSGRLGEKGVRISPEFAKAAEDALEDPFPTLDKTSKWNQAVNIAFSKDVPADEAKRNILKIRGLSQGEKSKLILSRTREDDFGQGKSIQALIEEGIDKNKQEIMSKQKEMDSKLEEKRSHIRSIFNWFGEGKDQNDKEVVQMQKDFIKEITDKRTKLNDLQGVADSLVRKNNTIKNPKIATLPKEGQLMLDGKGNKAIVYPDGSFVEVK